MDKGYPAYIPIRLQRGGGKTSLAATWGADQLVNRHVGRLLVASHNYASLRDGVMESLFSRLPTGAAYGRVDCQGVFHNAKVEGVWPQYSELRIKGRYNAAVLDNLDLWPAILREYGDPANGENEERPYSMLAEEVLAWTFGPILFTYTDPERLPEPYRSLI